MDKEKVLNKFKEKLNNMTKEDLNRFKKNNVTYIDNNDFLNLFKEDYHIVHENNIVKIDDDICFVALATEYGNQLKLPVDDEKRYVIKHFTEWLELFFKVCDGKNSI